LWHEKQEREASKERAGTEDAEREQATRMGGNQEMTKGGMDIADQRSREGARGDGDTHMWQ